jgi:hypothetical protein
VEGAPASKHLRRQSDDGVRGFINTVIQIRNWYSHHRNSVFLEPQIAPFVALRLITHIVAYSIDLNGEMCLRAIKIEDVWADWMLAAKDGLAWKARAQSAPQPRLRY